MNMNKRERDRQEKFYNEVLKHVADLEEKDVKDEEVQRLMKTPDTKMILSRSYDNWTQAPLKEGWSRQKIMRYGAKVAARNIVMSKLPMYD